MNSWLQRDWFVPKLPRAVQLGLATAGLLALELAVIRWLSGQVRLFAYFNNLILIGAFLGMGLGVAVGRRRPTLLHWTVPALLVFSVIVAFSDKLGIMHMAFPDNSVYLWGSGAHAAVSMARFLRVLAVMFGLLWFVVLIFLLYGSAVGHLFARMETLRAYSSDLLGSLVGVLLFAVATSLNTPPPVWFAMGMLPLLYLSPRLLTVACAAGVVLVTGFSVNGALFSPYNRIDLRELSPGRYRLQVNRDFHQYMHDLSVPAIAAAGDQRERGMLERMRDNYDIPFVINRVRDRALIVGAGTGNDVQAAIRAGYETIYSVDIDGTIMEIGRRLHPEQPYRDARVKPVVNDARAFFEQYDGPPFDVVCYGLLDSHAMFSAMSSLRLENYVYSEEGLRSAWELVSEGGHLSVSFSVFAGEWIADRMYWTLAEATGQRPVMIHHGMHHGRAFIVAKTPGSLQLHRIAEFPRVQPSGERTDVTTVSDDWPFLFIRPGQFPWGYLGLLGALLVSAGLAVRRVFGRVLGRDSFDAPLFLMGAAFLLLETRGVTTLSLLFGSTWVVNAAVFGGILATALLANLLVQRFRPTDERVWFVPLAASLLMLGLINVGDLNQLSIVARGVAGGLLIGLPVGFAGVIVSIRLSRSENPTASLGSNLLGAVVGGCLEYLSMWTGLRALVGFALVIYLLAFALIARSRKL